MLRIWAEWILGLGVTVSAYLVPAEVGEVRVSEIQQALSESAEADDLRSWIRGTPLGQRIEHAETASESGTTQQRKFASINLGEALVQQSLHLQALLEDHRRSTVAVLRPLVRNNRHVCNGVRSAISAGGMAPGTSECLDVLDVKLSA